MRKRIFGRRFKRDINQRKALFRSLMRELVLRERIQTTEAKAKSIKAEIERHVTKAKIQGEASRVHLQKHFTHDVVNKIVTDIAPRFATRPGGYTRIVRMGNRLKDNAPMVYIEWVEKSTVEVVVPSKKRKDKAVATKSETKEAKVVAKDDSKTKSKAKSAPKKAVTKGEKTPKK
jgi:large subunit ribosomal protein L17